MRHLIGKSLSMRAHRRTVGILQEALGSGRVRTTSTAQCSENIHNQAMDTTSHPPSLHLLFLASKLPRPASRVVPPEASLPKTKKNATRRPARQPSDRLLALVTSLLGVSAAYLLSSHNFFLVQDLCVAVVRD